MSKQRLEGKVAVITGAASGIGEAAARLFAAHGALVVIADIQDDAGNAVVASIGHDKCSYKHCDVTDEAQVEETVRYAVNKYGRIDVAYANAGRMSSGSGVADLDLADMDRAMAVNVRGAAAVVKHAARAMIAAGTCGSIVCTASIASCLGGLAPVGYTVSKHAVLGLVRAAAADLGARGIRVNCVSPHGVATPLTCAMYGMSAEEFREDRYEWSELKGVGLSAGHVAEAALFLASEESAYVSGHSLAVDVGSSVIARA